jgi:ABC-2 type transport system permease protein
MRKLLVVTSREFVERVRSKWFIVATLLGPVFYAAVTLTPIILSARTKPSSQVSRILVLDASGAALGDRVAAALVDSADGARPAVQALAPPALPAAETTATREVVAGAIPGYLVLEFGSVQGDPETLDGLRARYGGRNASSLPDMERIRGAVRQSVLAERLQREGLDPVRIRELTAVSVPLDAQRITEKGRGGSGMASVAFGYAVAFLLYVMIVLYGQTILRGVLEEKMTRVSEVVVSSVPTDTLLAGKVLGVGAVALLQQFVWVALGLVLLRLRAPLLARLGVPNFPVSIPGVTPVVGLLLLLFFVLGFVLYASLFAAVGAMVSNQEDAQQAAMPVMLLLVASVVFISPVLLDPMSRLSRTMSRLPFSAPILMPLRMSVVTVSWSELLATVAGLAAACALAVWLAARIYRVGLLMYGKRPTMGELVRWVRYEG